MKVNIGKYRDKGCRTVKIHIENFDTWSLDHTLSLIILPGLLQLRNTQSGLPHAFGNVPGGSSGEEQRCFDFYTESYDDAFNIAEKQWNEVMDKMIWSFQQLAMDNYHSQYHHGESELSFEKVTIVDSVTGKSKSVNQIVDKNPNGHWYDSVGHELHNERIQEGLDLFGKYYRSLWD